VTDSSRQTEAPEPMRHVSWFWFVLVVVILSDVGSMLVGMLYSAVHSDPEANRQRQRAEDPVPNMQTFQDNPAHTTPSEAGR